MPRLSQFILTTKPFRFLHRVTSKIYPPGFEGLSLYVVSRFLWKEIRVNKLNVRGAAVTYNFIMAIPPTLLFLCSLIPYMPVQGIQGSILSILRIITPNESSYATLSTVVTDFFNNERRDVLSLGILFTLFFSSNGMMGLMRTFDRRMPFYKHRSGIHRRWTAIKLTVMVLIVAILTMAALILQTKVLSQYLPRVFSNVFAVQSLSLLLVIALIFLSICMIYKYGPSLTRRMKFVSPGSVFATLFCILLTAVFFFLVNNVIHYSKVYGSIGTVMAFMVWLFLNTQVLLLGFELNVSILLAKMAKDDHEKRTIEMARQKKEV